MQLQLPLICEILAPDDIGIKKKKKKAPDDVACDDFLLCLL
jgi:hypothetical protein